MKQALTLLVFILALGLKPSPPTSAAAGDCLYDCEGSMCYDFSNKTQLCQETRAKCQARCSGRRVWGALAYSARDKGSGWSIGWNDVNQAKADAMKKCAKEGSACKLWAYFENECGALAADGEIVTWGTAAVKENAQRRALQECSKAGGKNCQIAVWACSKP